MAVRTLRRLLLPRHVVTRFPTGEKREDGKEMDEEDGKRKICGKKMEKVYFTQTYGGSNTSPSTYENGFFTPRTF
jgi:hypothetical protein